ncbi:hypothetical protein GIB67_019977, partial [Kingdonia uniflora]
MEEDRKSCGWTVINSSISRYVQENIFTETNELTKSTQVFLDALNELRLCHVLERTTISSTTLKRESLKTIWSGKTRAVNGYDSVQISSELDWRKSEFELNYTQDKPSNYSSRSRSKSDKSKTPADASTATATATASSASVWEKDEDRTLGKYYTELRRMWEELNMYRPLILDLTKLEKQCEEFRVAKFLAGLRPEYEYIKTRSQWETTLSTLAEGHYRLSRVVPNPPVPEKFEKSALFALTLTEDIRGGLYVPNIPAVSFTPNMIDKIVKCKLLYNSNNIVTNKNICCPISFKVPVTYDSIVYWLTIDYLLVAKSAVSCGSYFTSVMYVEHWCEDKFNGLMLGSPDFSPHEMIPPHIEILISAVTQINDPDSLYGIIRSDKLTSQIITFEHERNWSKALEYYDLQVRSEGWMQPDQGARQASISNDQVTRRTYYKGLMRSLQQTGCTHVLDLYCQGLTSQKGHFQHDSEFTELQYEAAWRAGNWDFSLLHVEVASSHSRGYSKSSHFNENLHRNRQKMVYNKKGMGKFKHVLFSKLSLKNSKVKVLKHKEIVFSIYQASKESTKYIHSSIIKLQILDHLGMAWDLRWRPSPYKEMSSRPEKRNCFLEPISPTINE